MQTVLSFIVILGILIFVHELGHLIIAKRSGILCREFAIGFGPKIFSFRHDETLYTIRILPLGGYVRMAGEDPEMVEIKTGHDIGIVRNEEGKVEKLILNAKKSYPEAELLNVQRIDLEDELFVEGHDIDEEWKRYDIDRQALLVYDHQEVQIAPRDRQFGSKTLGKRFATILAGPLANFALAVVLFIVLIRMIGGPEINEPILGDIREGSPADEAGLQEGDEILAVNGEDIESLNQLQQVIQSNPGQELAMLVQRGSDTFELTATPMTMDNEIMEGEQVGLLGFEILRDDRLLASIQYGFTETAAVTLLIFEAVGTLITGEVGIDEGLAGPVGIFQITGQFADMGLAPLINFTALFSVNLAILNLLPIPALDGGRLIFLILEGLRGKPIDPHKEGVIHFIGFALIMLLVLVVTWNDIQRVFFN